MSPFSWKAGGNSNVHNNDFRYYEKRIARPYMVCFVASQPIFDLIFQGYLQRNMNMGV
jgi:hypothetical protein